MTYNYSDSDRQSFVEEPAIAYAAIDKAYSLRTFLQDRMSIVKFIQAGIPYSFFEKLKTQLPFSTQEWTEILGISLKSLQRYQNDQRSFKPIQSEKIISIAEVIQLGIDVFEDMDKLKLWLDTPTFALADHKPKDLLHDAYGKELVMTELIAIEHGIFA